MIRSLYLDRSRPRPGVRRFDAAPVYAQPPAGAAASADPAAQPLRRRRPTTTTRSCGRSSRTSSSSTCRRRCRCRAREQFPSDAPVQRGPGATTASARSCGNLFGLDNGANIGLEFRYRRDEAPRSDRAAHQPRQDDSVLGEVRRLAPDARRMPVGLSAHRDDRRREQLPATPRRASTANYAPALGAVVSRTLGNRLALYATPMWVHNTGHRRGGATQHRFYLGLGGRLRLHGVDLYRRRGVAALGGFAIGDAEYAFSHREARRRARVLADVRQHAGDDLPADRARRRPGDALHSVST